MPRKLKPYKVDTVIHSKYGLKTEVYLDREDKDFFGKLHGDQYRAKSAAEVKRLIWDAMEAWRPLEWNQIILIEIDECPYEATWSDSLHFGCKLEFSFDRVEVSKSASGREIVRPFLPRGPDFGEEAPIDWQLRQRENNDDWDESACPSRHKCLPYDETVWQTLVKLKARTDTLTAKLTELLGGDPKRLKDLGASMLKALPAADEGA